MNTISKDTVIIGSGLTGLTAAFYAKKKRTDFLVLEKSDKHGGVIQTVSEGDFLYEEGPNTGVIGNEYVVELFDEISDIAVPKIPGENVKKRYILKNGKWHALPSGLISGITTPLFTIRDKFRILGEPFRSRGKDPEENLIDMVKRRLGNSYLNYAVDPFIGGVYAGDPKLLIPRYALPKLYNLEQTYGSFIRGAIKKKFEPKTELQKRASRKVFSFPGGLTGLTSAIFKKSGTENFLFGMKDIRVEKNTEGYDVHATGNDGQVRISAKNIITTTGAYELPQLLPFVPEQDIKKISQLHYTRVIEVAVGLNKWEGIPLDGFGGLIPYIENRDLLGILFMSSLFRNRAPENGALLSVFIGGVRKEYLYDLTDDEVIQLLEKEFRLLMGLGKFTPDLLSISRHRWAIPQYGIDSPERFQTVMSIQEKNPGLLIGGNLRNGIGIADRIQQGRNLIEDPSATL